MRFLPPAVIVYRCGIKNFEAYSRPLRGLRHTTKFLTRCGYCQMLPAMMSFVLIHSCLMKGAVGRLILLHFPMRLACRTSSSRAFKTAQSCPSVAQLSSGPPYQALGLSAL